MIGSIVIPAHDEAALIDRILGALRVSGLEQFEIVVACNGCTDDTAPVARAHDGVIVVETEEVGKIAGLRLGDAAASHFPRFYVDADVRVDGDALAGVAEVLRAGEGPRAGAPRLEIDTDGCSPFVRAYYGMWVRTPWATDALVGSGLYGVNEAGHERIREFPDVLADDLWVSTRFALSERVSVASARFVVEAPPTLRSMVRRKARIAAYQSIADLAGGRSAPRAAGPVVRRHARSSVRGLVEAMVFTMVGLWTRARAWWLVRTGSLDWVTARRPGATS